MGRRMEGLVDSGIESEINQLVSSAGSKFSNLTGQDGLSLRKFCSARTPRPQPPRPNTYPAFSVFDPFSPLLTNSPSSLVADAWSLLLQDYPGQLPTLIDGIIKHGCCLGYRGPQILNLSKNLDTAYLDPVTMSKMRG